MTDQEYVLAEGETLASTTTLDSRITYCNPAFVRVSGFSEAELLGHPHNLVRHPDMPSEVFRDMWHTLRSGRPWVGVVKNRRKDGRFYWVEANVTPVLENGQPHGYMSVRTKASHEKIAEAEALYAQMNEEAARGPLKTVVKGGFAQSASLLGRVRAAAHLRVGGRMAVVFAGLLASNASLEYLTYGNSSASLIKFVMLSAEAWLWLNKTITSPLTTLIGVVNRIAAGDLGGRVHSTRRDQIGDLQRAVSQVSLNLQAVVGDVKSGVDAISGTAGHVAQGGTQLSERTETQAMSIEQTTAALGRLADTVVQSTANTQEGARQVQSARELAHTSEETMAEVVSLMGRIASSSTKVGEIIAVIDNLAFQTNILALNAAVEAARAGEAGRGFAVVASEVRNLAQRSAGAAKEIRGLISASTDEVRAGNAVVEQARTAIRTTMESVERVSQLMSEISAATDEQTDGLEQVRTAVASLERVTQQNASLVYESAGYSSALTQRSRELSNAVSVFNL